MAAQKKASKTKVTPQAFDKSDLATVIGPILKTELMSYVGPLFEELKGGQIVLGQRLGKVENEVGEVKVRLGKVENEVGEVKVRLGKVENEVGEVKVRLGRVENEVSTLKESVNDLRQTVRQQGIDIHEMKVEVRTALEASTSVLREEEVVANHEERIVYLERDVKILKSVKNR